MGKIIEHVNALYEQGISVELTKGNLGYIARIGDVYGEGLKSKFEDTSDCFRLSRTHVNKKFNVDSVKEIGVFYSNKSLMKALKHAMKWIKKQDKK